MPKIFVVTGSNKGIGYAIVKGLSEKVQDAIIYLTARNPSLGQKALAKLKSESNGNQKSEIRFHQLDITSDESCKKFAEFLKDTHGGLDVLINNAGVNGNYTEAYIPVDPIDKEAEYVLGVNYYGTKRITKNLMPLIRPGGRIICICSLIGVMDGSGFMELMGLGAYGEKHVQRFKAIDFSERDIDDFVEEYISLTKEELKTGDPTRKLGGFFDRPYAAYAVSKCAEIAYVNWLAREVETRKISVNGCCPGWVMTDMTSHTGNLTPDEGADTPIFLALEEGLPNGKFYSERKVVPWP